MAINFFASHTTSTSETGFTLVELVATVAIIAMAGAIAIPNFSSANSHLKQAARELYGNLQRARMETIKSSQNVGIVFDAANNQYFLCQNANNDNDCSDTGETIISTTSLNSYGSSVQFASGLPIPPVSGSCPTDGISYATNTMVFSSSGRPSNIGYTYLTNKEGTYYVIGTPSMAGVVVMKKWEDNSWQ